MHSLIWYFLSQTWGKATRAVFRHELQGECPHNCVRTLSRVCISYNHFPIKEKCNVQLRPSASLQIQESLRAPAPRPGRVNPRPEPPDPPYGSAGESHNLNSMPICSCASAAEQMSISCLCWLRVTHHPSELTPAPFHKVNLPLKTCYLPTCLIEIDGSKTFIEFFYEPVLVLTPFIRASLRRGCYSSWTPALAAIACLVHMNACTCTLRHKDTHRQRGRHTDDSVQLWVTACKQWTCVGFILLFPEIAKMLCWAKPGCCLSLHGLYLNIILKTSNWNTFRMMDSTIHCRYNSDQCKGDISSIHKCLDIL